MRQTTVYTVTHCQPALSVSESLNETFSTTYYCVGHKQYNKFNMANEQNGDKYRISRQAYIHQTIHPKTML